DLPLTEILLKPQPQHLTLAPSQRLQQPVKRDPLLDPLITGILVAQRLRKRVTTRILVPAARLKRRGRVGVQRQLRLEHLLLPGLDSRGELTQRRRAPMSPRQPPAGIIDGQ